MGVGFVWLIFFTFPATESLSSVSHRPWALVSCSLNLPSRTSSYRNPIRKWDNPTNNRKQNPFTVYLYNCNVHLFGCLYICNINVFPDSYSYDKSKKSRSWSFNHNVSWYKKKRVSKCLNFRKTSNKKLKDARLTLHVFILVIFCFIAFFFYIGEYILAYDEDVSADIQVPRHTEQSFQNTRVRAFRLYYPTVSGNLSFINPIMLLTLNKDVQNAFCCKLKVCGHLDEQRKNWF